jgi:hypothetical protein
MTVTLSITEAQLFQALGDFISGQVACEVVRGMQNRTSMPPGDFIAMSPLSLGELARPVVSNTATSATYKQSKQWGVQLDCYGETSLDTASLLVALFRTDYACEFFAGYAWELQPLYAEEPRQMPLIAGEEQYVQRWTFTVFVQYNPSVTVTQDSANALTAGIINVDANYPA